MEKPTKAELAYWEAILDDEGLSMARGIGQERQQLPDNWVKFADKNERFDWSLRWASAHQGEGRAAGLFTEQGKKGSAEARKRHNEESVANYAAGKPSDLDAMFAARNKSWADPVKKAARVAAIKAGKAARSPEQKAVTILMVSQNRRRGQRAKFQIWPPTPRFTGVGQLWPVFQKQASGL